MEEISKKNQMMIEQVPAVIDSKISHSEIAAAKEINSLKEKILSLSEDKKKEVNNLKAEISSLREEIKNDVIALKADIKGSRSEHKADLASATSMMYYRLLFGVFGAAAMGIAAVQSIVSVKNLAIEPEGGSTHSHTSVNSATGR